MATGVPQTEEKYQTWYEPSAAPSFWHRFRDKALEHPIIPIGLTATVIVLGGGLRSFIKGASGETQNKWMRARIYAQGFTILCIAYYTVRPGVKKQEAFLDEKKEAFENKKSPVVTIN